MALVIDASATVAWFLPDEFDDAAESLLNFVAKSGALVPSLWVVEIENALRNAHRRKRITEKEAAEVLSRLTALPITIIDAYETPVFHHALQLSIAHDISVYDAVYLDAARRHNAALATRDKRLCAVATHINVPIVTEAWHALHIS